MSEPRSPLDAMIAPADIANLVFDSADRVNAFALAGRLGPGGFVQSDGSIDLDRARDIFIHRALRVPQLRQVADTAGRVWRWRDATLDPAQHIRAVDASNLEDLCADRMSIRLDRAHPLWEILLVPHLEIGCAGILIRIHHAVADGLAAALMLAALADTDGPVIETARAGVRPTPGAEDTDARQRLGQLWRVISGSRVPGRSALLGDTDGPRAIRFAGIDLAAFHAGTQAAHGSVNDGVLAAVAGALSTTLHALGENPPSSVTVSVPVALAARAGQGNAIGSAMVPLPLSIDDPAERIRAIHPGAVTAIADARLAGEFPPVQSRWMMRQFVRYSRHQRKVGLVTSNVHGPASPLCFDGAPLVDMHAVGTLGGNVRISIVAASYAGTLSFAVHTAAAIPADILHASLTDELDAIARLAR
ncbi:MULTISPECIES: wax ester/triacylglycerol synthase domain-containing protein [Gordonia]|uniref:diacylglycerol O-acyltransferase n=1 Tax=Gordonia tangerina TaxID=2911060 RepID=A0ABS9DRY2_9ACTN|nr:wax ester/triacylglycerol synthase domain-containing protein [Gordonia tangerina]MCF3941347.1 WS/DGAT domain-containing protein [Gordonia tangerina]